MSDQGGYEGDGLSIESVEDKVARAQAREDRFRRNAGEVPTGAVPPAADPVLHADELAEFHVWQRSQMNPRDRKAAELAEQFERFNFDNAVDEFWQNVARALVQGEKYQETVESFRSVMGTFDALKANLDQFTRKIKQAFEEDAEEGTD